MVGNKCKSVKKGKAFLSQEKENSTDTKKDSELEGFFCDLKIRMIFAIRMEVGRLLYRQSLITKNIFNPLVL